MKPNRNPRESRRPGQPRLGTDANDRLMGSMQVDFIKGGLGDDTLNGRGKNDILMGELGNDILMGDQGNDKLDGGEGDDQLSGGVGDDHLIGGLGDDQLQGGAGKDKLMGDEGDDTLNGGAGNDMLHGGIGDDTLLGGQGNDLLIGYKPEEMQVLPADEPGSIFDDSDLGDETLLEADPTPVDYLDNLTIPQIDTLTGGQGRDTFVLGMSIELGEPATVFYNTAGDSDYAVITDFRLEDRVQLAGIATDYTVGATSEIDATGMPTGLPTGAGIYQSVDGQLDLIAVLAGVNAANVSLTSRAFVFV